MNRWPVVRHIRWAWLTFCFYQWWRHSGRLYWIAPNVRDLEFLDSIWNGEA